MRKRLPRGGEPLHRRFRRSPRRGLLGRRGRTSSVSATASSGVRDKEAGFRDRSNLRFYSQYAGVRKAYQSYGLGILIKEFQREMVLGILGVSTVICTYDPLTGVNAHRNVRHFGMDVLEYRVATYGEYGGLLNRLDVPTDRFLMSWDLERKAEGGRL